VLLKIQDSWDDAPSDHKWLPVLQRIECWTLTVNVLQSFTTRVIYYSPYSYNITLDTTRYENKHTNLCMFALSWSHF